MTTKRQNGFVFVEAMVALTIIAMALTLMFSVLSDGTTRTRMTKTKRLGLLVAQSRLAAVGIEYPLRSGSVSGVDGDFGWTVSMAPYRAGPGRSEVGNLFVATAIVRPLSGWGASVTLRSVRLEPPR